MTPTVPTKVWRRLGGTGGTGGTSIPNPGTVSGITATGTIDPVSAVITLNVTMVPSNPAMPPPSAHIYFEGPDQSSNVAFQVGVTPLGSAAVTGTWTYKDLGIQAFPAQPWQFTFPAPAGIDPTNPTPCRVYVNPVSADLSEATLVQANQPSPTPSATFVLTPKVSAVPTSGSNITVNSGPIAVQVLPDDTSSGQRRTPVLVLVSSVPQVAGWVARLVMVWYGDDPTDPSKQQIVGPNFIKAGKITNSIADGIQVEHTFVLDTPKGTKTLVIYAQAGTASGTPAQPQRGGVGGERHPVSGPDIQWNNIVPGITPDSGPVSIGSVLGNLDLTATYNYSPEFHIDPATNTFSILNVDMSKAVNLSSQFSEVAGLQTITGLAADILVTGKLQVGGGGNKVSLAKFFDTTGVLMGFWGDDRASAANPTGSGYVGSWSIRTGIGGAGPLVPNFFCDSFGNVVAKSIYVGDSSGNYGFIGAVPQGNGVTGYAWFKNFGIGGTPLAPALASDAAGNLQINGSLIVGNVANATTAAIFTGTVLMTQLGSGTLPVGVVYAGTILTKQLGSGGSFTMGVTLSQIIVSGTTATVYINGHGLRPSVDQIRIISGAGPAALQGTYVVTSTTTNTFVVFVSGVTAGTYNSGNAAGLVIDVGFPVGVVSASQILAEQIVAGTITATVKMTSPILQITSGSITVNMDGTNVFKITDTSSQNQLQWIAGAALKIVNTLVSTQFTTMAAGGFASQQAGGGSFPWKGLLGPGTITLLDSVTGNIDFGIDITATHIATSASTGIGSPPPSLPANPAGFYIITVDGVSKKFPYYNF